MTSPLVVVLLCAACPPFFANACWNARLVKIGRPTRLMAHAHDPRC